MDATDEVPTPYPSIWQSLLIVGIAILMSVACSPLLMLGAAIGNELAMMCYYFAAFGLTFYIADSMRKRRLGAATYQFQFGPWWLVLPLSLGSVALLFGVIAPIQSLIPMPESIQSQLVTAVSATSWPTFIYFVLAAPILEELIFRGIILDGFLKRYTPLTSILVSSLLFGLAHLNPWQFVTGFVIGCFLGWVYFRTHSVGACIVIHMAANFSGFVLRLLLLSAVNADEQTAAIESANEMTTGYFAICALLLCVFAASIYVLRREFDKQSAFQTEIAVA